MTVLMAIDARFVTPLFVTVTSLVENLADEERIELYILSNDLTPDIRRRLGNAWQDRVRLRVLPVDLGKLEALSAPRRARPVQAAYARLLAGSSLPPDVSRVLYLDADLLVRSDLLPLWQKPIGGNVVLAVQDSFLQRPFAGDGGSRGGYFNSGVMLIDLDAWRAESIEERCFAIARTLRSRTRWRDQDILNAALAGRWGRLSPRWNRQFWLDLFPDWQCSPHDADEVREALADPAIVHFCGWTKPWHPACDHAPEQVAAHRAILRRSPFAAEVNLEPTLAVRVRELLAGPHRRVRDRAAAAWRAFNRRHAVRRMLPGILRCALRSPWTFATVPLEVFGRRLLGRSS